MKIAKGCKSWILSAFIPALLILFISFLYLSSSVGFVLLFVSVLLFILTVFFLVFFRDPDRKIANGIVACADGKIREIVELNDNDIGKCYRVSTFMNVQNVHVNRMIFDGKIKSITHFSGFHLPAFKKESDKNERIVIIADTNIGIIKIVQIAGTLARRIVPYVKKDDNLKKGERIGIIRLGSRVDVYLPFAKIKNITVRIGSKVKAGEDKIAEINA
jgi:phosphatidylserine decarboxylase